MSKEVFFYKLEDIMLIYSGRTVKELELLESNNKELLVGIDEKTIEIVSKTILNWETIFAKIIMSSILGNAKIIKISENIMQTIQSFFELFLNHEEIFKLKDKIVVILSKEPFKYYTISEINEMMLNHKENLAETITEQNGEIEHSNE